MRTEEAAPIEREREEEDNRNQPSVPKMHIDPEEPRDESTVGKYRPRIRQRYHNQRRNGDYHYQYENAKDCRFREGIKYESNEPYYNSQAEHEDTTGFRTILLCSCIINS